MKQVILNCAQITQRRQLHELLAEKLEFPEWYGHNLDALHDCLTELGEDTKLILSGWKALQENLGDYAVRFVFVLHQASEENPNFRVELEN